VYVVETGSGDTAFAFDPDETSFEVVEGFKK